MNASMVPMITGSLLRGSCTLRPAILALLREVLPEEDFADAQGSLGPGGRGIQRSGPRRAAGLCKQYLRLKHGERLPWVEDFIMATERAGACEEDARWERLIDVDSFTDQVLEPLDLEFERWLER